MTAIERGLMKVAFGLKAHSGWAVLVGIGEEVGELRVTERRRLELVESSAERARQPYHRAQRSPRGEAGRIVEQAARSARRLAVRELEAAAERAHRRGQQVVACSVLTTDPLPEWSLEEILAVHFRLHRAEGVLFREALARAVEECGFRLVPIREKDLASIAERALVAEASGASERIAGLGRSAGAPWGRDQKEAALAALVALRTGGRREASRPRGRNGAETR